jgi:hypothetical protein
MSGDFRKIDPHPPPACGAGGGHTRWVERGWDVNSSEDARLCSVLYICKYFVHFPHLPISLVVHRHNVQEHRVALLWTQPGEACTQGWEHSSKKEVTSSSSFEIKFWIFQERKHSFFYFLYGGNPNFASTKYDLHKFNWYFRSCGFRHKIILD